LEFHSNISKFKLKYELYDQQQNKKQKQENNDLDLNFNSSSSKSFIPSSHLSSSFYISNLFDELMIKSHQISYHNQPNEENQSTNSHQQNNLLSSLTIQDLYSFYLLQAGFNGLEWIDEIWDED